ncbi:hypothetical protein [Neorhizobium sp. NCHU2750]|uniref:hypothetical protein n=1 Tax=Neorhizobium sp. NCHU2750 TaxID=1825976 RepID=UPI000E7361ED|nr:hypothetical protein NCHU2750_35900 [Neorhizobium sp. NCHU2750]
MSNVPAVAAPQKTQVMTLADGLTFAGAMVYTVAQVTGAPPLMFQVASVMAIVAVLSGWTRLAVIAKTFVSAAFILLLASELLLPAEKAVMVEKALYQGVGFSSFLSMLGMLRYAVGRSEIIRNAAEYLMSMPGRRRYQAVKVGSHLLSLLFNIGIISLIGQMVARATEGTDRQGERRSILLAAMRGTVLMTIWSPLGVGFAIITQSIPNLAPTAFVIAAFATTIALVVITTIFHTETTGKLVVVGADDVDDQPSVLPLMITLCACFGLFACTMALHAVLDVSPLVASLIVLPLFAIGWVHYEQHVPVRRMGHEIKAMIGNMAAMRTESAIYLSASVIGATAVVLLEGRGSFMGELNQLPPALLAGSCILAIAASAVLFIPHSIVVVFLAQLFGAAAFGNAHPILLALALSLGWAAGIALSPISAMTITMARLTSTSATTIVLRWNGAFAVTVMASSLLLVLAIAYL